MNKTESKEKKKVALVSLLAAIFITIGKLIVGLLTGSIGIISEAIHSGFDFVAAGITYLAVKISDKPADSDHQYGHGKVENLSAFVETILLFITSFWIIYEAIHRMLNGGMIIDVNIWAYGIIILSIIIDFTRSRSLMKIAKKYNSQALEADALHFSTDILSSFVVLLGLVCAQFHIFIADSIAAILVAIIVLRVAFKLGKRSVDILLDKTSTENYNKIKNILINIPEVLFFHDLKVRMSGSYTFVDVNIHVDSSLSIIEVHNISDNIERKIKLEIDKIVVHIHQEPNN